MTPEEVERHLQSRQNFMELVPERAPPTVPTEMFSNEPSLDRYIIYSCFNVVSVTFALLEKGCLMKSKAGSKTLE